MGLWAKLHYPQCKFTGIHARWLVGFLYILKERLSLNISADL